MVQTGIIAVSHLGEAEIRAFAGVCRDDVVDDDGIVRGGHAAELQHLRLGAEVGVDVEADAVEIAVDGRGEFTPAQTAGALHRAVVNALHAKFGKGTPEPVITQRLQHRAALGRDDGGGVGGEPYRGNRARIARPRLGVGALPEPGLAGIVASPLAGRLKHGLAFQPFDVAAVWCAHDDVHFPVREGRYVV